MKKVRVRRLPVTERNGRLIGILSMNDLARETWREIEAGDRNAITADLAGTLSAICERRTAAGAARKEVKSSSALVSAGA